MAIDLSGIESINEYYTNHYFSTMFEESEKDTIKLWSDKAKEAELKTPWAKLRNTGRQYGVSHNRYGRVTYDLTTLQNLRDLADSYLENLDYPQAKPKIIPVDDKLSVPVYLEVNKPNGAPQLWVLLSACEDNEAAILERNVFDASLLDELDNQKIRDHFLMEQSNEDIASKIFFDLDEPPRFLLFIGIDQIALVDRNKWNDKRYLQFNLDDIFGRREDSTLKAMTVLLDKDSLCPKDGQVILDQFDEASQKNASGVSNDLKYALRESIERLGNEVLYDMEHRQGRNLQVDPVDPSELTLQCIRYMYRMLFVLFIESRPDLGYAPMKSQAYFSSYSLESLRDIAENVRDDIENVGKGYYLFETLEKLYQLIYSGYPDNYDDSEKLSNIESKHDIFEIPALKAHLFDPERTKLITNSKIRNHVMLRIIDLMSVTRGNGKRGGRARISYSNLGINQMGAAYEALLSYRGFIAKEDLYEVKSAKEKNIDELEVGYFVPASDLDQYNENERVYTKNDLGEKVLKVYKKGTFIYRLAGREREKSASYYTPEVLTKCLVKYALKELLEDKTADEILNLKICEPAMGSAAFLNETINQLAEAYLNLKQKELHDSIPYNERTKELQRVKMYIADRNVYGIDLNPTAVELAEVSLWLNTIYDGSYVPWFATQIVNGNSLIGARKQVYTKSQLQTKTKGDRWFDNAPKSVPVGEHSRGTQFYHFLLGDPGMSNYKDKVIKELEPENIKLIKQWNKEFTKPYTDEELVTLRGLSRTVDELWDQQVNLQKEIDRVTQDNLGVYGHETREHASHFSIREKDRIYQNAYKSIHQRNASAYARLKFAMDYWCSLWFWPIEQAKLLPDRSKFLMEMRLILGGTVDDIQADDNKIKQIKHKKGEGQQLDLFTEEDDLFKDDPNFVVQKVKKDKPFELENFDNSEEVINALREEIGNTTVDLDQLCSLFDDLKVVREVSSKQKFMHWELEFADLFDEQQGFDLIIGNPPWVKLTWNETDVLSESNPIFSVRNLTAPQTSKMRKAALSVTFTRTEYLSEYSSMTGQQNYLNASANFKILAGQKANLYKCFLPQAWIFTNSKGISSFIHPNGVFDDPNAGKIRKKIYQKLVNHFQFENEYNLFQGTNDHGRMRFSLNVYKNGKKDILFRAIFNVFLPKTIDECFERSYIGEVPGLKDRNGKWATRGHPDRLLTISRTELNVFSKLFEITDPLEAPLLNIHSRNLFEILKQFSGQPKRIGDINKINSAIILVETLAQKKDIIEKNVHFAQSTSDLIISGPHIGIATPLYKTPRRIYNTSNDYDAIDINSISDDYLPRTIYNFSNSQKEEYYALMPVAEDGQKYTKHYQLVCRRRLGLSGERTLISAIAPKNSNCLNSITSVIFDNYHDLLFISGILSSIPYDGYIRFLGRTDLYFDGLSRIPLCKDTLKDEIELRALVLNSVTKYYSELWQEVWKSEFRNVEWTKTDPRLKEYQFCNMNRSWSPNYALRTDFARRQAIVELDVLTAMSLGMTLQDLKELYRLQFPVSNQYDKDTWYDSRGRIVFTNNKGLTNIGFSRKEWEGGVKGASAGKKFYRTITDDTLPGGPVERTIEYVAPFDRCDREKDYETAWKFFEEKYGPIEA